MTLAMPPPPPPAVPLPRFAGEDPRLRPSPARILPRLRGRGTAGGGGGGIIASLLAPPLTPPHKGEVVANASEFPSLLWGGVRGGGMSASEVAQ